jgi:O-methyltransferase
MLDILKIRFSNWKNNPRKWRPAFIAKGIFSVLREYYETFVEDRGVKRRLWQDAKTRQRLMTPPMEPEFVEILLDKEFVNSVAQVKDLTCLDFARLANVWNLARTVGPGIYLEVGTFRGGTALHICNAIADRETAFYCFDPFEKGGYEKLGELDNWFKPNDFTETRFELVRELLSSKPYAKVIQGYFPDVAEALGLKNIAFCHLDVNTYDATQKCLEFLAPRISSRGLIIIDDYGMTETPGVAKAVTDFLAIHPSFILIPIFPVQAVLLPKLLW